MQHDLKLEDYIEIKPIRESPEDYDKIEERLKRYFKTLIYYPLLRELSLSKDILKNKGYDPLLDALFNGRITYSQGKFSGKFNAQISKSLKDLGAHFDKKLGTFNISYTQLPLEVKNMLGTSERKFQEKMNQIDRTLSKMLPEQLSSQFKCEDLFDRQLYKADKQFHENIKKITVAPRLTDEQRSKIAKEWQNNMDLWIKNFTTDEIKDLRQKIQESTLQGNRYESMIKTIQDSYEVSADKAKFLARQETNLMFSKFKEVRYVDAGANSYIWRCVHRPHDANPKQHTPGNVRYSHGLLDGKIFSFNDPPITTNPGQPVRRNNPGQDFNCRCYARPLIKK